MNYEPSELVKISRYQNYFPTLPNEIQRDIHKRMNAVIAPDTEIMK